MAIKEEIPFDIELLKQKYQENYPGIEPIIWAQEYETGDQQREDAAFVHLLVDCDIKSPWKTPLRDNIIDEAIYGIDQYEREGKTYHCLWALLKRTEKLEKSISDMEKP